MKLIGVELRVGFRGWPFQQMEAKLVPVEIVYPNLENFAGYSRPVAEVTFHASTGDVTVNAELPPAPYGEDHVARDWNDARKFLERQINGLRQ